MGRGRGHSGQGGSSGGRTAPSPSKRLMPQRSGKPNTVLQRQGLITPSSPGNPILPASALGEFAGAQLGSQSFWVRLLAWDVWLRGWAVYKVEVGDAA